MERNFLKNRNLMILLQLGVDVGIKDFAVLSTYEKIENPKYLKNSLMRLKVLQKRVSRKPEGKTRDRKTIPTLKI